jgi:hypothetical protein
MKIWLGVIGRACVEFAIILVLISFVTGAAISVVEASDGIRVILKSAASSALLLVPLAAIITLFLAFFSFEIRVKSRLMGWIGLLFIGAILFSFGIGARKIPLLHEMLMVPAGGASKEQRLIPMGTAMQQGRVALWIGSFEGGEAHDAVAVDFGSDYPRLTYSPRAGIDSSGNVDIQGRTYLAALPAVRSPALVPEASIFAGFWIWDRLAAMGDDPLPLVLATAGGFLLLVIGFRFLCRITLWPFANALLAAAGLVGLVALDAFLSGSVFLGTIESLSHRFGLPIHGPLIFAGIEGFVGLALGAADLAAAPRGRMRLSEASAPIKSGRRIFGVAILIDSIAFAAFFGYAIATYSANRIVPTFALKWELVEALRNFFRALAGLQFLGLAVALGSHFTGKAENLVQGAIVPIVALSALLAALSLIVGPQAEASRSAILSASSTFTASLDAARAGLEAGDLERARAEFGVCQAIARKDARLEEVEKRLTAAEIKVLREATPLPAQELSQSKDPVAIKDYYLKALKFAEKGDYFSANFYASLAARLDPSYTDARRLAATSWEELHKRGADPADKARAEFYTRKLEGYGLLRSGDPVGAYRVFKGLSDAKHADDPDVRRYLAESLTETEKTAFFKDEINTVLSTSLVPDIFFRVPDANAAAGAAAAKGRLKAGPLRIIVAKDATWSGGSLYFREFEYLEAGSGGPRALVRSPYAKLTDGRIFLVCVERDRPATVFKPTWSIGPSSGPASLVELPIAPESAYRALAARVDPSSLSLVEDWKAVGDAKEFGIDPRPIIDDLLERSALPFAMFTAAALGALAGTRFRRRGGPFPMGLYALVPIMAAALLPVFLLAARIDALISVLSAKIVPGLSSLLLAAGIRTIVLFLAVLLMAGARDVDGPAID